MKRYTVLISDAPNPQGITHLLNTHAAQGWRLVCVVAVPVMTGMGSLTAKTMLYLEREGDTPWTA